MQAPRRVIITVLNFDSTPDDGQGYLVTEGSFLPLTEETGFGSDTPPNVFRAAFHHTTLIRLFTH
jgi:hypothetical protein